MFLHNIDNNNLTRYAADDFWNKIPLNINNATSLQSFGNELKENLLTSEA